MVTNLDASEALAPDSSSPSRLPVAQPKTAPSTASGQYLPYRKPISPLQHPKLPTFQDKTPNPNGSSSRPMFHTPQYGVPVISGVHKAPVSQSIPNCFAPDVSPLESEGPDDFPEIVSKHSTYDQRNRLPSVKMDVQNQRESILGRRSRDRHGRSGSGGFQAIEGDIAELDGFSSGCSKAGRRGMISPRP